MGGRGEKKNVSWGLTRRGGGKNGQAKSRGRSFLLFESCAQPDAHGRGEIVQLRGQGFAGGSRKWY